MHCKLYIVCLLIALLAELLEARRTFKRDNGALTQCESGFERCPNGNGCLHRSYICDNDDDCGDEAPEFCNARVCEDGEFRCTSGQCISKSRFCLQSWNKSPCRDKSDVTGVCLDFNCPADHFQCKSDGKCVSRIFLCDNHIVCEDGSDEAEDICPPVQCQSGYARCPHHNRCILKSSFCDRSEDCPFNSDESPELCINRQCEENEVRCASGQCLDKERFCRLDTFCQDRSLSTLDASLCTPVECAAGYERCPLRNHCIKRKEFCNRGNDCFDWSDENSELCAERVCEDGEFRCANGQCLLKSDYCTERTYYSSCADHSEVKGVCLDFTCPAGYFKCKSDGLCINDSLRCSGSSNCNDASDEAVDVCPPVQCDAGFERCPNTISCIGREDFCNNWGDCFNDTDEDTELCENRVCEADEIRCASGQCLKREKFCRDKYYNCRDRSHSRDDPTICPTTPGQICLLRTNEENQPIVVLKIMQSCTVDRQQHPTREQYCQSEELQRCAMRVMTEECGDEMSLLADEILAALTHEICNGPIHLLDFTTAATTALKRQGRGLKLLEKIIRSLP